MKSRPLLASRTFPARASRTAVVLVPHGLMRLQPLPEAMAPAAASQPSIAASVVMDTFRGDLLYKNPVDFQAQDRHGLYDGAEYLLQIRALTASWVQFF